MDAIEAIKTRRSVRRYTVEPIPDEILEDIIDCARLAPTARNEQPWTFVVITDPEVRERLAQEAQKGRFIAGAPACVAVFCRSEAAASLAGCRRRRREYHAGRPRLRDRFLLGQFLPQGAFRHRGGAAGLSAGAGAHGPRRPGVIRRKSPLRRKSRWGRLCSGRAFNQYPPLLGAVYQA